MSGAWLGGILGQAYADSVALELGTGVNFCGSLTAEFNPTTGVVDVTGTPYLTGGPRPPVVAASPANIADLDSVTLATAFDDVTPIEGDRVAVPFQTDQSENGIYVVGAVSGGVAALSRASDFATASDMAAGASFYVQGGTLWGQRTLRFVTTGTIAVGSTDLEFRDTEGQLFAKKYQTTDASSHTAYTITLSSGLNLFAVRVFGSSGGGVAGGGEEAEWETKRHYLLESESVTEASSGDVTPYYQTDGSWGTPSLDIDDPDVDVNVTGKAATTITWIVRGFVVERH